MVEEGHPQAPRITRDAEWYDANPHARMSFSRLATYERCPAWFRHQYLDWHRTWELPVLRAGHLVQNALERVFDSEPAADVTLESLQERARGRFRSLLQKAWEAEKIAYEKNPNAYGSYDLSIDRYLAYGERGLEFHIQELRARLACRHPRTGQKLPIPEVASIAEAWREVRPQHAKHGAAMGETMEHVPEGYLQGEYDLVYTWTGGRRIVDLKASGGDSPFSKEVQRQLASYALLEARLGRGAPEGMEAWFLGKGEPVCFPQPAAEALTSLDDAVQTLIERAGSERGFGDWDPREFPAAPAPVPGFEAEGANPSIWCSFCPAALVCSRSEAEKVPPRDGIDLSDPSRGNRTQVRGVVLGVGEARDRSTGKQTRRFTLGNGNAAASFTWPSHVVERLIQSGLRAGRVVRLSGLRAWKHPASGTVLWYDTPATELDVEEELFGGPRADPEALHPSV